MPPSPSSVVVVGAGISGVACARELADHGIPVRLVERSYRVGGRMASRRLHGRRVDTGASYLTCRSPEFQAVLDGWLERGLARPWTDRFAVRTPAGWEEGPLGPLRYGTPGGLRSLVEDLATGLGVRAHAEVADVGPGPTVDGQQVRAVVLAMPDPQAADLLADELLAEVAAVRGRDWLPTLALCAGWQRRRWRDVDGAFVHDDPVLDRVTDDGRRRGDGAAVLVAQTTAAFAEPYLDRPHEATGAAVDALCRVMEIDERPDWTYLHRWSLARPAEVHDAPYHLADALVGLCGDGWGAARVEAAWTSGRRLGTALVERLG